MTADDTDHDALSDRVAAQGVRDLLNGRLTGPPLEGTLARMAWDLIDRRIAWRLLQNPGLKK